jgi:hypothetical protein
MLFPDYSTVMSTDRWSAISSGKSISKAVGTPAAGYTEIINSGGEKFQEVVNVNCSVYDRNFSVGYGGVTAFSDVVSFESVVSPISGLATSGAQLVSNLHRIARKSPVNGLRSYPIFTFDKTINTSKTVSGGPGPGCPVRTITIPLSFTQAAGTGPLPPIEPDAIYIATLNCFGGAPYFGGLPNSLTTAAQGTFMGLTSTHDQSMYNPFTDDKVSYQMQQVAWDGISIPDFSGTLSYSGEWQTIFNGSECLAIGYAFLSVTGGLTRYTPAYG